MNEQPISRLPLSDPLTDFGRVAGELVHDLANDVQVLQGWASLARGEIEQGSMPVLEVERVVAMSQTMGRMLQDVLSVVAGQTISPEASFDPVVATERALQERLSDVGTLEIRFRSALPAQVRISGRESFWTRAVLNLARNALRHARNRVDVSLSLDPSPTGAEVVVLRVEDDGPGVLPQMRALVFEPLLRGESGGFGFGLSSVAWSAEHLGGKACYAEDSELGGAAFEVRVPSARPVATRRTLPLEASALQGRRVLLIDDDPAIRFAVARLLRRVGAEVHEVDPADRPDDQLMTEVVGALPDVILVDLHFRDRGGMALWKSLNDLPELARRVLFISGSAPGDPSWDAAMATGRPVLGKPFDVDQLIRTLIRLQLDP